MASFLTYSFEPATANGRINPSNGSMDCVHRQCFLEVFLSPYCDIHYSSIPVCDAVPSKGPKITGCPYSMVFRPWPLRTEIVPDSLNLWMILCTVDDNNFKLFAIFLWETPFWYCSTIFRHSIWGIGDPLPILTSERHCHSERHFLYPIMLPIDLISCKLVLQLFLICTFNFSGLLLLPVPTFLECVALMKSKMSQYLAWHFKMSHFQYLICYLYSIVLVPSYHQLLLVLNYL